MKSLLVFPRALVEPSRFSSTGLEKEWPQCLDGQAEPKASFSCHRHRIAYHDSSHRVKSKEDQDQCKPDYIYNKVKEGQNG